MHAAPRPTRRYPVEDFFATVAYYDASFSADGEHVLLSGNPTSVFNVHAVPVAGGALRPAVPEASVNTVVFSCDGRGSGFRQREPDA